MLPALKVYVGPSTVVVSIMAGRTLGFLEQALAAHVALIRAMPNTPAAIGRGITVAVPNARVSPPQRQLVHALLSATGAVEWIADEALMDAVTAVSGSGPAYVFSAGRGAGQRRRGSGPASRARSTACPRDRGRLRRTAAPLPLDPATLRQNVTSPGGTTAAALDVLMAKNGLKPLLLEAVAAATRRSRELAG